MKIFDNIKDIVRDDLKKNIQRGSKVSIAAACFSIYAYEELKNQLEQVEEFRFIFTSPTFVQERAEKQRREFYIPRLNRETSLYGTEFEIKLRNKMTQRAVARECVDWIKRKAAFKSNVTRKNMGGFMTISSPAEQSAYMPLNGFTTVDIGCERGNNSYNMVNRIEAPFSTQYIQLFETLWNDHKKMQDVTEIIISNISTVYNENSPEFIYFMTLYHVFSELTSTGDDDLINPEEKGDLEYRKQQLKCLQEKVVDIEDMSNGISIMDLGLNEFRLDLLNYIKTYGDLAKKPKGLHAVVPATKENPEGVIFVLRNINNQNCIHPFYMVYISVDGEVACDYLNPKKLLDTIRLLCRGKSEPILPLCEKFNEETDDGRSMKEISQLLSDAINSIIDVKEESDIDSLFSAGGTSALINTVTGLDDFELICFLVVK